VYARAILWYLTNLEWTALGLVYARAKASLTPCKQL